MTSCDSSTSADDSAPTIVEIAAGDADFSILVDALVSTGLDATLDGDGPFTVFAPTNTAFSALPEGTLTALTNEQLQDILLYHVLGAEVFSTMLSGNQTVEAANGQEVFVVAANGTVTVNGGATVTAADVEASNGVIHVVDSVILPDAFGDVVDNAAKRYFLTTLVEVVAQQGLADALRDEGTFTVFAPTNEAFAAIADVLPTLTPEQVTEVLLYHVVSARVLSSDLQPQQEVPTLNGQTISVTVDGSGVTINGEASVTTADVDGTNGVIHVIDTVLIPDFE